MPLLLMPRLILRGAMLMIEAFACLPPPAAIFSLAASCHFAFDAFRFAAAFAMPRFRFSFAALTSAAARHYAFRDFSPFSIIDVTMLYLPLYILLLCHILV